MDKPERNKRGTCVHEGGARSRGEVEPYLVFVSVVVVVMGPATVVCCEVVVVLWVPSEAQPEINARVTTARQEAISFFHEYDFCSGILFTNRG